jgi:hypothetical protein
LERLTFLKASLLLLISTNLSAFTLNNNVGARFDNKNVKVYVEDSADCAVINISNTELLDLATEAANRFWNTVATSRLRIARGELVQKSAAYHTGSMCSSGSYASGNCVADPALAVSEGILISCNNENNNFGSNAVLAAAIPNNISGRDIKGSIILINDRPGAQFGLKSREEQISILAHEIGHAVGLGHSTLNHNLMYYASLSKRERLGQDDIDGVTWLYPQKQPLSCGTISEDQTSGPGFFVSFSLGLLLLTLLNFKKTFSRSLKIS